MGRLKAWLGDADQVLMVRMTRADYKNLVETSKLAGEALDEARATIRRLREQNRQLIEQNRQLATRVVELGADRG